jgi:hypothetical protein
MFVFRKGITEGCFNVYCLGAGIVTLKVLLVWWPNFISEIMVYGPGI